MLHILSLVSGLAGSIQRSRLRERVALTHARSEGQVLGRFRDSPIAAVIVDDAGRRYCYAGVMPSKASGQYELEKLAPEEWIVSPGLVYRREIIIAGSEGLH